MGFNSKLTMRWLLVLLLLACALLSEEAFGQAMPSGWTPHFRFRKYAQGANPGSDSLNANWTGIDTNLFNLTDTTKLATRLYVLGLTDTTKNATRAYVNQRTDTTTRIATWTYVATHAAGDTTIVATRAYVNQRVDTARNIATWEYVRIHGGDTTVLATRPYVNQRTDTTHWATNSQSGFLKYSDWVAFNAKLGPGTVGSMAYADSIKYHGSGSITTLGTIGTGSWQGNSISTTYTDAKIKTVTNATNTPIRYGNTTGDVRIGFYKQDLDSVGTLILGAINWSGAILTSASIGTTSGNVSSNNNTSYLTAKQLRLAQAGTEETNAGVIDYSSLTNNQHLNIMGYGSSSSNRAVRIWDRLGVNLPVNSSYSFTTNTAKVTTLSADSVIVGNNMGSANGLIENILKVGIIAESAQIWLLNPSTSSVYTIFQSAATGSSKTITSPDQTGTMALTTGSTFGSGSTWNGNSISDSYLSTISTAGKVSGAAITSSDIATSGSFGTTHIDVSSNTTTSYHTKKTLRFAQNGGDETNAGTIDYGTLVANHLNIVGMGTGTNNRLIQFYDFVGIGNSVSTTYNLDVSTFNATTMYQGGSLGYLPSAYGATGDPGGAPAKYLVDYTDTHQTRVYIRTLTINGTTVHVLTTD